MDRVIPDHVSVVLHNTYLAAFDPMKTQAAARHVLSAEEFDAEMKDPRIDKYIVWDEAGEPIALTTLTSDLAAIPWVSREYYVSRYPDAAASGVLFYLGYILVGPTSRKSKALIMMTNQVNRRLEQSQGVLGFDMCSYNDANGIGRSAKKLLASSDRIERLDVQSYYGADYRSVPSATSPGVI